MAKIKLIRPVQPYLKLNAPNYKEITSDSFQEGETFFRKLGIANFYEFRVEPGKAIDVQAVPDGTTDLLFGIGDKDMKIYLGGTVLKAKDWEFEEGRTYFGARFLPGKCILPEDLSIGEVVNTDLELHKNEYGIYLPEHIAQGTNIKERAKLFIEYFFDKLTAEQNSTVHNMETYICNRIYATNGNITIKELSKEMGYSECYVRRSFEQIHGISPKVFERFVRFQNMINEVNYDPNTADIEEIALQCGYYDQSHMMKDFKAFTGTTPEKYKKMLLEKKKPGELE